LNQEDYRQLVSGRARGPFAGLLRAFLGVLACFYSLAIRLRNFFYDVGLFKAHPASAAVISIGNITAGGTGKTPLVVWLCNEITQNPKLRTQDCTCAILTRGYKAGQGPLLDEPAILAQSCPDVRVVVNPERVVGAAEAIAFGANVLIMDDGFQHRRLARDVDIVAIDATIPFGYGKILPAGLLREPVDSLKRADAVVITRCGQVTEEQLAGLEKKIRDIHPNLVIAKSSHAPVQAISEDGGQISLGELKGKKVFAFCGIGNPQAFFSTLDEVGVNLAGSRILDDHHRYSEGCVGDISEQGRGLNAEIVLTTQKDWSKVSPLLPAEKEPPFAYLAIEMRFLAGAQELTSLIEGAIAGRIRPGE